MRGLAPAVRYLNIYTKTEPKAPFQSVEKAYFRLPLSGVTPHSVGRCHVVTEGTAAVSGCHHR